ncbi:MAG: hypothetical protein GY810_04170 [Aureispira sp.]|nr:hypothetical protein [Aureispira sp.]
MNKHIIKFEDISWEKPAKGVLQKVYINDSNKMRIVRFQDDFVEAEWCLKGHAGFVLNGEMKIDFNGTIQTYKKGDGLWIEEGESSKHKVLIEKGEEVELLLFESEQ